MTANVKTILSEGSHKPECFVSDTNTAEIGTCQGKPGNSDCAICRKLKNRMGIKE